MADLVLTRFPARPDDEVGPEPSLLDRHLRCEQLTARRRLLTSLLALLSAPVWAMAAWPRLLADTDRRFLLYLFAFLLATAGWAAVEEWWATARLRRALDEARSDAGRSATAGPADRERPSKAHAVGAAAGRPRF
ncbi:MAG TPA: hypothetical protein PKJ99_07295 [Thermoanaerobaculales bacterium]|nr:hypothetical protein [Thermoanaerobaculales bacterium]HPA79238.1 hypothetical protein [Thermoanaerobaculales bacterium]HQL28716.1 hypothetical protein [Thermoanaerobaculales bacterium]HQN96766.1 hypothetical protein [Thermoanaerobaculales bacterium]HQP42918.1 hypothetical protein [Thermoanaerobaculales bacterium]